MSDYFGIPCHRYDNPVCDDFVMSTTAPNESTTTPTTSPIATDNPSVRPTLDPSKNPTNTPTLDPSTNPTDPPTLDPSKAPTSSPSSTISTLRPSVIPKPTDPVVTPLITQQPTISDEKTANPQQSASPQASPSEIESSADTARDSFLQIYLPLLTALIGGFLSFKRYHNQHEGYRNRQRGQRHSDPFLWRNICR